MLLHKARIRLARHTSGLIEFLMAVATNKWKELELDGPVPLRERVKAALELLDRGGLPRTVLQQISADTTSVVIDAEMLERATRMIAEPEFRDRFRVTAIEPPALPAGCESGQLPLLPPRTEVPTKPDGPPPVDGAGAVVEGLGSSEPTEDEVHGTKERHRVWNPDDLRF